MNAKILSLSLLLLVPFAVGAEKSDVTRKHALDFFEGKRAILRASVHKSYYWQTIKHECPVCTNPVHDIITIFKVEECYAGGVPVGTEVCCFHRSQEDKCLKPGDVYIFAAAAPIGDVQFLDNGELVPLAEMPNRQH